MDFWKYMAWSFVGWFAFYYSFEHLHNEFVCALAILYLMIVSYADGRITERKENN